MISCRAKICTMTNGIREIIAGYCVSSKQAMVCVQARSTPKVNVGKRFRGSVAEVLAVSQAGAVSRGSVTEVSALPQTGAVSRGSVAEVLA